eukprot:12154963-Alexandrium_andersonii.AAC.1
MQTGILLAEDEGVKCEVPRRPKASFRVVAFPELPSFGGELSVRRMHYLHGGRVDVGTWKRAL